MTSTRRDAYLRRLGVRVEGRSPDVELLRELQVAHLVAVPFENLHVFHHREVTVDMDTSVTKVVTEGRGGLCYELNGAFCWLLREVGFDAVVVACEVHGDDGWGPPFDHAAIVVDVSGEPWFVDVGFGDCCMVPVPLRDGEHGAVPRDVSCVREGDGFVISERRTDGTFEPSLRGTTRARAMSDFAGRNEHITSTPGLHWSSAPFATRATAADGSRVTLRPGILRTRTATGPFEDSVVSDDDWSEQLCAWFDLADTLVVE